MTGGNAKVPVAVPSNQTPMTDPKSGILTPPWRAFFDDLTSAAPAVQPETVSGSPYSYVARHPGSLLVQGGFVTSIEFVRARESVTLFSGSPVIGNASFKANKNGTDQTGILPSTPTVVTYTNEVWDYGGYYDATASAWTPPAGLVELSASMAVSNNVVDQNSYVSSILKNGSGIGLERYRSSGTGVLSCPIYLLDEANGSDVYTVSFIGGGAGNKTLDGSIVETWFSGSMATPGGSSTPFIPMFENDEVIITYTDAPEVYFFPVGNPA